MKRSDENTVVSVKIAPPIKKRLQALGKIKQRSTHWLMKEAITNYLKLEEHEEQLKQETIQRWQEMKEGKFLGNDKITEWLDRWGSDKEEERP